MRVDTVQYIEISGDNRKARVSCGRPRQSTSHDSSPNPATYHSVDKIVWEFPPGGYSCFRIIPMGNYPTMLAALEAATRYVQEE